MANTPLFTPGANQDKTLRAATRDYQAPAYAATLNIVATEGTTLVNVGALTGNVTVNVGVGSTATPPYIGAKLEILFAASGANRTVTFGTGLAVSAGTLVVVSAKFGSIDLVFNGAV